MDKKPIADFIVHNLAAITLFPEQYKPGQTPPSWKVEERANCSIASRDGMIVWTGSCEQLADEVVITRETEFFNGQGLLAIPGFIDSHTHLVYAGDRSSEFEMRVKGLPYLEILAAGGGILNTTRAVRKASENELFDESAQRAMLMLEQGVTTVEIKTGYGLDLETELKMLRVIKRLSDELPIRVVPTFMGAHAIPAEHKADPDCFVDEICRTWIPEVAHSGLAVFNDVFTERKAFTLEQSRKILETGLEHGLKPKIHVDEISDLGGTKLAADISAISADHLLVTTPQGISELARSKTIPTLLPGTSTFLMESHHAPARDMINAGLPVAIASDHNPGSSQFLGGPIIQSLAMLQLKMSASEALIAGTLHAAHALDIGTETGSIETGKKMDLALFAVDSYKQLGYKIGYSSPAAVIVSGRLVYCG